MKVIYEVSIEPTRKFAAIADEETGRISIGDYYRGSEGWLASTGELTINCGLNASETDLEIRRAIIRAFAHFSEIRG